MLCQHIKNMCDPHRFIEKQITYENPIILSKSTLNRWYQRNFIKCYFVYENEQELRNRQNDMKKTKYYFLLFEQ